MTEMKTRFITPLLLPQANFGVAVFEAALGKFCKELDANELPFLVGEKCVFTNKGIHILVKKLFSKKFLFFPWANPIDFICKITSLQMIQLQVSCFSLTLKNYFRHSRIIADTCPIATK